MNLYKEENSSYCYFHPKEIFVGVCPLCLKEKLLVLASKQNKQNSSSSASSSSSARGSSNLRSTINLPKMFAFGSILNRLELRHRKFDLSDDLDASTSQEDSFISIKFEDNGIASWEKNTESKVSLEHCSVSWNHRALNEETTNKSVIEHQKNRAPLRWHKRIGHMFQLIRLKRSSSRHVAAKMEGVKVRKQGWIRTITKRKPKK